MSFGVHRKNLNEDRSILSAEKCRPMTLVSGGIRFMPVFAEVRSLAMGRQTTVVLSTTRQRQLEAFSLAISSGTLEMRPALLHSHT